jgi:hypothetical protein
MRYVVTYRCPTGTAAQPGRAGRRSSTTRGIAAGGHPGPVASRNVGASIPGFAIGALADGRGEPDAEGATWPRVTYDQARRELEQGREQPCAV